MKNQLFSAILLASVLVSGAAFAGGDELGVKKRKVQHLDTLTATSVASGDFIPVYDVSADKTVKVDAGSYFAALAGYTGTAAELNYVDLATLGTGAASKAVVLDASGDYTYPAAYTGVIPSGGTETFSSGSTLNVAGTFQIGGVTVGATAAEINMAADISANAEITAATNPLTTAECGKTLTLSHATEFVTTLPAPTLGCKFSFIVANAPESADYTIVTADGLETISGVAFDMTGAAVSAGAGTAAADTISFVQAKAVISDRVDLFSDGIGWHGLGFSSASGAITYTSAQ